MNIKRMMIEAGKVSMSAIVGHKIGKMVRDSIMESTQIYEMKGDTIHFNRVPDGVNPIRTKYEALCNANSEYLSTAMICGAGTYMGLSKLEEVVSDHFEKKRMKKVSEVVSEEPTSETTSVTEEVTEE